MIPKILHYCWFGGGELPEKAKACIASWKKYCPDYEIRQWNDENYDYNRIPFIKKAAEDGKWSFVTDYVRLDVVYHFGGIYLDTDVELLKSPDDLLTKKACFGFEDAEKVNTGLGFGAEAGHPLLREMMAVYESMAPLQRESDYAENTCPVLQTPVLAAAGFQMNGTAQEIDGTTLFPSEVFCPLDYQSGQLRITEQTRSIHWYQAAWKSLADRKVMAFRQKLTPIVGQKMAGHIAVPVMYLRYKGLKETAKYYLSKVR